MSVASTILFSVATALTWESSAFQSCKPSYSELGAEDGRNEKQQWIDPFKHEQPAAAAAPALNGTVPDAGGSKGLAADAPDPFAGSQQAAPQGSQAAPTGSQAAPSGSQAALGGSQAAPIGSQAAPMGSQAAAQGSQAAPMGSQAAAMGSQAAPMAQPAAAQPAPPTLGGMAQQQNALPVNPAMAAGNAGFANPGMAYNPAMGGMMPQFGGGFVQQPFMGLGGMQVPGLGGMQMPGMQMPGIAGMQMPGVAAMPVPQMNSERSRCLWLALLSS